MTRPSGRVQAAAALATLLTAATLTSLVEGVWWFVEATAVVLAVTAAGAGTRRLTGAPWVPVVAQLAVLLVLLTWLYAHAEAVLGLLPGPQSTTRLLEVAAAGLEVTREVAPPAPAQDGVRLLAVTGVGAVAIAADLLAVGLRQPALAGLPLLATYCVPAALARDGLPWYWFSLAAAGYLLLVASDAGERVARWGRVLHGRGGEAAPLAATGRRVGALALAGAVVVPTLVPGLGEGLLFGRGVGDGPGPGSSIRVVNPIYSLRDNLAASQDLPVLSYETTGTPQPLRIVTVDTFDGTTWEPTLGTVPRANTASGGMPLPPGLGPDVQRSEERYRITIDNLAQSWLPVPYPPTRVDVLGPWLYDDALNVIGDGVSTEAGLSYDVRYLEVVPTPEQLLGAPPAPQAVVDTWGASPEGLGDSVAATAREVAGEGTAYERAVRLQQYFRSDGGFQYSVNAPDATGSDAISDFLARRSGYCTHFASAMALMARSLGIPARVAVGFLPGSQESDGSYTITLRDAHAWPELYFSGVGWVRFEPTPPTRTGALPSWAAPPPDLPAGGAPSGLPPVAPPAAAAQGGTSAPDESAQDDGTSLAELWAGVPWRAVGGLALLLALAGAPAATAAVVRRLRWRRALRAGDAAAATAEAAWTTLAERVRDLGIAFPASATPRQAEEHLAAGPVPVGARAALHRVARAVEQARYAPAPAPAEHLASDVDTVVRGMHRSADRRARWRAALLPVTGVEHARTALVDVGLALDRGERRLAARLRGRWTKVSASGRRAGGPSAPRGAA